MPTKNDKQKKADAKHRLFNLIVSLDYKLFTAFNS
jgi:hypothetical protein